jgi:hypothetical protein
MVIERLYRNDDTIFDRSVYLVRLLSTDLRSVLLQRYSFYYDIKPLFTKISTTLILFQSINGLATDVGFGQDLATSLA